MHILLILIAAITIALVEVQGNCGVTTRAVGKYRRQALRKHNLLRAAHGVPPLALKWKINKFSQAWADQLAANDTFEHRPRSGQWKQQYGENIYAAFTWRWDASLDAFPNGDEFASGMYTSEMPLWTVGSDRYISGAGHFTQIVWKNSCKLGVGIAFSKDCNTRYVVFNFDPPGNNGKYKENVRPAGSSAVSNSCSN